MATVNVRYMVDDVEASMAFYTTHLGFTVLSKALPAFADVTRGDLRLLLSGPESSAGRPMPDGRRPGPGGWNRIHLIVDDLAAEVARLQAAGVRFRNDIVTGRGGPRFSWTTHREIRSSCSSREGGERAADQRARRGSSRTRRARPGGAADREDR
jgi:catechol 2,3-dioxygenase-like lactoylglutathione lyase family enzyme